MTENEQKGKSTLEPFAWPLVALVVALTIIFNFSTELKDLIKRSSEAELEVSKDRVVASLKNTKNAATEATEALKRVHKDDPKIVEGINLMDKAVVQKLPENTLAPAVSEFNDAKQGNAFKPLSGKRILWVDDNPINNSFEASYLRALGASIRQVNTSAAALSVLKETPAQDLLITDLNRKIGIEDESGIDLINEIHRTNSNLPLVLYSRFAANTQLPSNAFQVQTPDSLFAKLITLLTDQKETLLESRDSPNHENSSVDSTSAVNHAQ